ncbi:hypothetical protein BCR34DRAFT_571945 [Clohesyomyces aquaticus]|uniref:Uncharacterized protein n=1 Tax=Clohesyomyces aquaticus TaxID=1231657 RepID=A0A1Y1Z5D7_9PLEO|nr:hypothetical protein BCR34DRAFT_571945 [Clohesyomyces aquaticus]
MRFSTLLVPALAALSVSANPIAENPFEERGLSTRADPTPIACVPGQQYCGWAMLDGGLNWDPAVLRFLLCDAAGDCNWTGKNPWNYIWYCQRKYFAVPQKLCGKDNSCLGPVAHCS